MAGMSSGNVVLEKNDNRNDEEDKNDKKNDKN